MPRIHGIVDTLEIVWAKCHVVVAASSDCSSQSTKAGDYVGEVTCRRSRIIGLFVAIYETKIGVKYTHVPQTELTRIRACLERIVQNIRTAKYDQSSRSMDTMLRSKKKIIVVQSTLKKRIAVHPKF